MNDLFGGDFAPILAAGFFVGIVVGLTGMGGGALMTPALIFLGVGDTASIVTADLTAAAVYKTGGAIVHSREGSPNLTLAKWLIIGSVPMALAGPHLVQGVVDPEDVDDALKLAIGFALLLAAATYALRLYINLRRVRGRRPPGRPEPEDPARPDDAGRRARRPAGRHHQRRLGLGDHGRAADALPRALRRPAGRHRPRAGGAAGARRGDLQHRRQRRPRLGPDDPADHRLGARHDPRQPDRPAGAAVVHPPRHRRGADDVRGRAARQGRLGAARRARRPTRSSSA